MKELQRYNSVAISLHWLIAVLILALLAMGKYMTHLEVSDPLRYTVTQWHKSAGITVLLLASFRLIWRFTHKPPTLPQGTSRFAKAASHLAHMALYLLMVVIPVSGWVMVSASPLNIQTLLFGIVPWPHISYFTALPEREIVAEQAALTHLWLGNTIIFLVVLHTSAALFHQWIRKDRLISRMVISDFHRRSGDLGHGIVAGVLLAVAAGLFLTVTVNNQKVQTAGKDTATDLVAETSGNSSADQTLVAATVGFTAVQSGNLVVGEFTDVEVELSIDKQAPESSSLSATVMTGSVNSNDTQLDSTMVTRNWFGSKEFPHATFQSTGFEQTGDSNYLVTGELTIRDISNVVEFDLWLEEGIGSAEFPINRRDFGIGDGGQDEFVEAEVMVRFTVRDSG